MEIFNKKNKDFVEIYFLRYYTFTGGGFYTWNDKAVAPSTAEVTSGTMCPLPWMM